MEADPPARVAERPTQLTAPTTEVCEGVVVAPYRPRLGLTVEDDAEALLGATESEIFYLPEYYYWDRVTDTSVGCADGGTLRFTANEVGADLTFDDCGLSGDITVAGTGTHDFVADRFTLEVSMGECSFSYQRAGDESLIDSTCD